MPTGGVVVEQFLQRGAAEPGPDQGRDGGRGRSARDQDDTGDGQGREHRHPGDTADEHDRTKKRELAQGPRPKRGTGKLPNFVNSRFWIGPDVEQGGQTADGRAFHNVEDYKKILLQDKDQVARNLTQKLLIYSTGADIQFADRQVVEQIVTDLRSKNYGFRTLIHDVVQSRVFLNK